ncbi:MAG TPA: zeta toxin family protein [Bacteroidia bacterium]|jgi:predicted ABC-type ATPase|nr:zeta toxin family protein [Bacteroidia bacterium]
MPNLYIIAGPNGAGKTTASYNIFPKLYHCETFVNADEIAKGLSPFNPEKASFEAGKLMLQQVKKNLANKIDFALETTLSTKYYFQLVKEAKVKGYTIILVFLWLESVKMAKERVKIRVEKGGHNIPLEIITRRYERGLKNFKTFAEEVDRWVLINNGNRVPSVIAEKIATNKLKINDKILFSKIINYESSKKY